jgi:hypothetical protein
MLAGFGFSCVVNLVADLGSVVYKNRPLSPLSSHKESRFLVSTSLHHEVVVETELYLFDFARDFELTVPWLPIKDPCTGAWYRSTTHYSSLHMGLSCPP